MRVVQLAAEAAEAKRPFTRADLTEETLAPVLTIELAPTNPLWRNTADAVMATMTRGFEIVIVPGPKPKKGHFTFALPDSAVVPVGRRSRFYLGPPPLFPPNSVSYWLWADFPVKDLPGGDLTILVRGPVGEWNYFLNTADRVKVR